MFLIDACLTSECFSVKLLQNHWKLRTYYHSQTSVNYTMNGISWFCEFLIGHRFDHSHNKSQKFINSLSSNVKGRSSSLEKSFSCLHLSCAESYAKASERKFNTRFSYQSLTSQKHSVYPWKILRHYKSPRNCISSSPKYQYFFSFIKLGSLVACTDLQRRMLTIQSNNIFKFTQCLEVNYQSNTITGETLSSNLKSCFSQCFFADTIS